MKVVLIRYGELTLKGKNRKEFERILYNNIRKQLEDYTVSFSKDRNRIYIEIEDNIYDEIKDILKIIPGISSFSVADVAENTIESISSVAINSFDKLNPVFKVETKRSNKDFEMTSQEVSRHVGGEVLRHYNGLEGLKVDVHNPLQTLRVEIQRDKSYVFHTQESAMGGLPIGTSGRGLVLLSGGIDSPVAAIQAMKRGLKIDCIHFSSPPYTNEDSFKKVLDLVKVLHKFDKDIRMFNALYTDIQVAIYKNCDEKYGVSLLRRMMLRTASKKAEQIKAKVLITGEALGQVASQTIDSMSVTDSTVDDLIIRPLITMDKNEIIALAKRFGTYEISILPFEDCCVVFLPKNPIIKPKLHNVLKEEEKFDYNKYLDEIEIELHNYDIINKDKKIIDKYL